MKSVSDVCSGDMSAWRIGVCGGFSDRAIAAKVFVGVGYDTESNAVDLMWLALDQCFGVDEDA